MLSCCYKSGNVSHIYHQVSSYLISDLTETLKINGSCISAGTCHDQLRLCFFCFSFQLIIINKAFVIYSIRNNVKIQS